MFRSLAALFVAIFVACLLLFLSRDDNEAHGNSFKANNNAPVMDWKKASSIYDFEAKMLLGDVVSLDKYT